MSGAPPSLWREPEFAKLWLGQSISLLGSQITILALPLAAVQVFAASPAEMGVLGASQYAPYLLFGLIAGAWVDRVRRRPILIAADVGRAVLLASITLALLVGLRSVAYLDLVAFLTTSLTVVSGTARQAYLPSLIPTAQLVDGNSRLEASRSVARVAGSGFGGALVQLATAPFAILFDAVSFLISAVCLLLIRRQEPAPRAPDERSSLRAEIGEGIQVVVRDRTLRTIAGSTGIGNFFDSMFLSIHVIFLTRYIGVDATTVGLIYAMIGAGACLGSLAAGRLTARLGPGPTIVWAAVMMGPGYLGIAMTTLAGSGAVPLLLGAALLLGVGSTLYNVNLVSMCQALTPDHLRGRVNGTMLFLMWGAMPIGALLGGALGEVIGVPATMAVAAGGIQLAVGWIALSPVRLVRARPTRGADQGVAADDHVPAASG